MEATELRIGNYIDYTCIAMNIVDPVYKIECGADIQVHQNHNYFKPIPLTEQWFKDFGFKQDETKRIWGKDGIMLIRKLKRLPFCLPGYDNSICKYVHQLQNLYFALTSEELIKS